MAARHRMDLFGFVLLGTITGVGGGTTRDLILDRPVFWLADPLELLLCVGSAIAVFAALFVYRELAQGRALEWADALGLGAFCIQGTEIAIANGSHPVSAVFLGVLSAVGGGLMRDIIAGERPFILTGELYASAALAGAATYLALLPGAGLHQAPAALVGFLTVIGLRSLSVVLGVRLGAPGDDWIDRKRR
jgi:uncharacterized membrane protein YeiH